MWIYAPFEVVPRKHAMRALSKVRRRMFIEHEFVASPNSNYRIVMIKLRVANYKTP